MGKRLRVAWSGGWKRFKDAARGLLATALPEGTWSDRRKFIMSVAKGIGGLWLGSKVLDRYPPAMVPAPSVLLVKKNASDTLNLTLTAESGSYHLLAGTITCRATLSGDLTV